MRTGWLILVHMHSKNISSPSMAVKSSSRLKLAGSTTCTVSIYCATLIAQPFLDRLTYRWKVTHYAEGTLMPLLVNKLIFHLIPQRTPFFLRFISTVICNNVLATLVEPRLKENRAFVRLSSFIPPDVGRSTIVSLAKPIILDWRTPRKVLHRLVCEWSQSDFGRLHDALPDGGTSCARAQLRE